MRAQNLTVSIPVLKERCDKNCPYCISLMTPEVKPNWDLMLRNARKVQELAWAAKVTSVLLTSKGEPFLNYEQLTIMATHFLRFPLEVQTNGVRLKRMFLEDASSLNRLSGEFGVNVVAISMDKLADIMTYGALMRELKMQGIVTRVCMNVTSLFGASSFAAAMSAAQSCGFVDQILFRRIGRPEICWGPEGLRTKNWIEDNDAGDKYDALKTGLKNCRRKKLIRTSAFGNEVWAVGSIAVMFSDYCLQEESHEENIRSLVFKEDGHVYTNWSSEASVLF